MFRRVPTWILCTRIRNTAGAWLAFALLSAPAIAAEDDTAKAPIKRVVLFNSGVGYFEHQGEVEGDASIELKFDVDDVNDLLKSMVLEDHGGGKISTVTYGSRDPITKTLQSFSIDLTSSPTLGQLLAQIRGEQVELTQADAKIAGAIVGVETQRHTTREGQVIEEEFLNVLSDEGLQRVPLNAVRRIKLARAALDDEFRQALKILASSHDSDKKAVTLEFRGEGKRDVRVGYIQEAPVWKTSYRLVLDEKDKPFLQGWAIVENTTDADWSDVQLSLVSGRPISFTMDLYSPLYATRPVEVPEMFATLRPQVYDQDLVSKESLLAEERKAGADLAVAASAPVPTAAAAGGFGGGANGAARFRRMAGVPQSSADFDSESLGRSVEAAAQAGDVGELFKYEIDGPVTLARQSSAMLPIINQAIEGEEVSIYNPAAHAKHPLNGVRVTNSSDLHLMQGPVTVFDGGVYAGDAKLADLAAGAERLLSYALDLDIEVAPTSEATPRQLVRASIDKGVVTTTFSERRSQSYAVKNSGDAKRTVLVEYPIAAGWDLVAPAKPTEKTRDLYRFAVVAEPNMTADLKVEETQTIRESVALGGFDAPTIEFYIATGKLSAAVKDALREVARRNGEIAKLQASMQQFEQELAVIGQEQERIRPNMNTIDRNSELYGRYMKKFAEQEDQIDALRENLRDVNEKIAAAQQELNDYVSGLTLE